MSFDYAGLREGTVEPLIARFGKAGVFHTPAAPPANPYDPPGAATDTSVTLVQTEFDIQDRQGTVIEEGDVMFLVSTDGDPSIEMSQSCTVEGVVYQVVGVKPLKPGPVLMLWKAHCRR